jgi:DNA-binding MarR family transcriptional regulator
VHADQQPTGIDAVYAELERVSRRAVARARARSAPLSFVEHSLVTFIASHPGCRAIDIAADFSLNRSTVSRQLAGLVELGLVTTEGEEAPAGTPEPRRGQVLALTSRGDELLARSVDANRAALAERLESWRDDEVDQLAASLHRLNTAFGDGAVGGRGPGPV